MRMNKQTAIIKKWGQNSKKNAVKYASSGTNKAFNSIYIVPHLMLLT